jgi:hypothetical protein
VFVLMVVVPEGKRAAQLAPPFDKSFSGRSQNSRRESELEASCRRITSDRAASAATPVRLSCAPLPRRTSRGKRKPHRSSLKNGYRKTGPESASELIFHDRNYRSGGAVDRRAAYARGGEVRWTSVDPKRTPPSPRGLVLAFTTSWSGALFE